MEKLVEQGNMEHGNVAGGSMDSGTMEKLLDKYAKLVVCTGVNLQKGQLLVVNADFRYHRNHAPQFFRY